MKKTSKIAVSLTTTVLIGALGLGIVSANAAQFNSAASKTTTTSDVTESHTAGSGAWTLNLRAVDKDGNAIERTVFEVTHTAEDGSSVYDGTVVTDDNGKATMKVDNGEFNIIEHDYYTERIVAIHHVSIIDINQGGTQSLYVKYDNGGGVVEGDVLDLDIIHGNGETPTIEGR